MLFNPPLYQGLFLRRYKRFLADIQAASGEQITLHCPNTGSMRACLAEGTACWYSISRNPKRKYAATWEIATTPQGHLAGINTGRANALVGEAIHAGLLPELAGWSDLTAEVRYGEENSRADWCVQLGAQRCYIEVKNATLLECEQGYFPDAVSARGSKHLRELIRMVEGGQRALLVYCVQHSGINSITPAAHIDPQYAQWCVRAREAGVEFVALKAQLSAQEIRLTHRIAVDI
ncbi:MAG: Sugar fermentation stimulation protein [Pseudomonadota bacterium]|jgi:sugar fermentation stimulation protein A